MGDIADSLIDGEFDYITGEYIGEPCGYPRTYSNNTQRTYSKKIKAIRKELALLIEQKQSLATTVKERNHAVTLARQEINTKYGKGWRELF
jgi:hypothetical protein